MEKFELTFHCDWDIAKKFKEIMEQFEKGVKFTVFKYSDGTVISEQHDEMYDGPWKYGEANEKVFEFDYPFPWGDISSSGTEFNK